MFFAGMSLRSGFCYDNQSKCVVVVDVVVEDTKCEVIWLFLMEIWVKNWDRVGLFAICFSPSCCTHIFFIYPSDMGQEEGLQ